MKNADILFIDDSSIDGTLELINVYKKKNAKIKLILNNKKMGVGNAHLNAIYYAYKNNYALLITMDADFTHNPSYIKNQFEKKNYYLGFRGLAGYTKKTIINKSTNFLDEWYSKFSYSDEILRQALWKKEFHNKMKMV